MDITFLIPCNGVWPTKIFSLDPDGSLPKPSNQLSYYWDVNIISVRNIELFCAVLHNLHSKPCIIIRGTPVDGLPDKHVERNSKNFKDTLSTFLMIDVDGAHATTSLANVYINTVRSFVKKNLPKCFHDVSCVVQYSCSAGVIDPKTNQTIKPGLCCHLFFELDTPISNEQAKSLLHDCNVDLSLYTPVQPHYIMSPVISSGIKCKINKRIKLIKGKSDIVKLPPELVSAIRIPSHIPSRSNDSEEKQSIDNYFTPPTCGLPSQVNMLQCDFMQWFVTVPPDSSKIRYNHAFAFTSNAYRTDGNAEQFVLDSLSENIPDGYIHAEKLLAAAPNTKPCSCRYIVEHGYNCKHYNDITELCTRSYYPVTSPYGLAIRAKLRGLI